MTFVGRGFQLRDALANELPKHTRYEVTDALIALLKQGLLVDLDAVAKPGDREVLRLAKETYRIDVGLDEDEDELEANWAALSNFTQDSYKRNVIKHFNAQVNVIKAQAKAKREGGTT